MTTLADIPIQPGLAKSAKLYKDAMKNYLVQGFSPPQQIQMPVGQGPAAGALQGLTGSGLGYLMGGAQNLANVLNINKAAQNANLMTRDKTRNKWLGKKLNHRAYKYDLRRRAQQYEAQAAQQQLAQQDALMASLGQLGALLGQGLAAYQHNKGKGNGTPSTESSTNYLTPLQMPNLTYSRPYPTFFNYQPGNYFPSYTLGFNYGSP